VIELSRELGSTSDSSIKSLIISKQGESTPAHYSNEHAKAGASPRNKRHGIWRAVKVSRAVG
jgi:hypothetical protein